MVITSVVLRGGQPLVPFAEVCVRVCVNVCVCAYVRVSLCVSLILVSFRLLVFSSVL